MKSYLLDTSTCVSLFCDNREVAQRLNKVGREHCYICDVVLAELRYGAFNSDYVEENLKMIDEFVKEVKVLPFADSIDVYAQEKVRLRKGGQAHRGLRLTHWLCSQSCRLDGCDPQCEAFQPH